MFKIVSLLLHFLLLGKLCSCQTWDYKTYPPAPSISVNPSRHLYSIGDRITLTCSLPHNDGIQAIRYFRSGTEIFPQKEPYFKEQHTIALENKKDEGNYSCGYVKTIMKKEVPSYGSKWINIRIAAYPPAPSISVNPSRHLYSIGDRITLTCSLPHNDGIQAIRYFKNGTEIHLQKEPYLKKQHTIVLENKKDEGNYSCGYVKIIMKKEVLSYGSKCINIRIADSTSSWIYYLTGCGIIPITSLLAFLLFKVNRKRNKLKEVREPRGSGTTEHHIPEEPTTDFPTSRIFVQKAKEPHLYSKIEYRLSNYHNTSEQADRFLPPSRASEDIEEQNQYSEIAVCPFKEQGQHQPQQHSSSRLVKQSNTVYCTAKAIDVLPVVYHTVLTQTTKERNYSDLKNSY